MITPLPKTKFELPRRGESFSDYCNELCSAILLEAQRLPLLLHPETTKETEALHDCAGNIACAAQELWIELLDDPHVKNSEGAWVPADGDPVTSVSATEVQTVYKISAAQHNGDGTFTELLEGEDCAPPHPGRPAPDQSPGVHPASKP